MVLMKVIRNPYYNRLPLKFLTHILIHQKNR
jgi:hypothetical protein